MRKMLTEVDKIDSGIISFEDFVVIMSSKMVKEVMILARKR